MRIVSQLVAIAALCAAVSALAGTPSASEAAAAAPPVATAQACDVTLNVHDPDPKGLNVRATPSGRVVTALKPDGEWTEVPNELTEILLEREIVKVRDRFERWTTSQRHITSVDVVF